MGGYIDVVKNVMESIVQGCVCITWFLNLSPFLS